MKKCIRFIISIVFFVLLLTGCEVGITPLEQSGNEVNIVTTSGIDENGNGLIRTEIPESAGEVDVKAEIYGNGSEYFAIEVVENNSLYEGIITENPNNPLFYENTTFQFFTRFILNGQEQCIGEVTRTILRTEVAPIAYDQNIGMDEDTSIELVLKATDRNNDTLEYNITRKPSSGTLSGIAPFLTYTPYANYYGTDSFTYVAKDEYNESNVATVNIIVTDVIDTIPDTTAPIITLTGDNPQVIEVGEAYVEQNASTNDGSEIVIDSTSVDMTTVGDYNVTYNATDSAGNVADTVTRMVTVIAKPIITLHDIKATEGETFELNVSLDRVSHRDITMTLSFIEGNATAGKDYNFLDVNVTISAGSQSQQVPIDLPLDSPKVYDPNEIFYVQVSAILDSSATVERNATVMIEDIDGKPKLYVHRINQSKISEGGEIKFRVKLEHRSHEDISIKVRTTNRTAEAGLDYTAIDNNITMVKGILSQTVTVYTIDDNLSETVEEFTFDAEVLSGETSNTSASKKGTIIDNENTSFIINDLSVDENSSFLNFDVNLTLASASDVSIMFTTVVGSAGVDDYNTSVEKSVIISAGSVGTQVTMDIGIIDDDIYEGHESFILIGSSLDTNNSEDNATVTIVENESMPILIMKNANAYEGEDVIFDINLSVKSSKDINVSIWTNISFGTARKNVDYEQKANGYLDPEYMVIPAGTLGISVPITTFEDDIYEENETFRFVSEFTGDRGSKEKRVGTIINDDPKPTVSINNIHIQEGEDIVFTVTLSHASYEDINLNLLGTVDGIDINETITIEKGKVGPITMTISTLEDTTYEPIDEQGSVSISVTSGDIANEGVVSQIVIVDDDFPPLVTISDASAVEAKDLVFEVNLSNPSYEDIEITLGISDIIMSGGEGIDYSVESNVVTIAAGETGVAFIVKTLYDEEVQPSESDEILRVNIDTVVGTIDVDISDIGLGTIVDRKAMLFAWCDVDSGVELWRTHGAPLDDYGNPQGTYKMKDLNTETDSKPENFLKIGYKYYFTAIDETGYRGLWVSDGTSNGTRMITTDANNTQNLTNVNGTLFFTADIDADGAPNQVYKLNADESITHIAVQNTSNEMVSYREPSMLTIVGNTLFFVIKEDGNEAKKVVRLDLSGSIGLAGGTKYDDVPEMIDVSGVLYYVGVIGTNAALVVGTDNNQNSEALQIFDVGDEPRNLYNYNGSLVFSAQDDNGRELWISDGTAVGTRMYQNYAALWGDANPHDFALVGSRLYFSAREVFSGQNLRYLDNLDGARILTVTYGENNIRIPNPENLVALEDRLFFDMPWVEKNDNGEVTSESIFIATYDGTKVRWLMELLSRKAIYPYEVLNNEVLFRSTTIYNTEELWVVDTEHTSAKLLDGCGL